ncbi:related to beta-1,4-mannosyltransferase [Cephalotrichum gorgonifer]|uniref:Chitobiosyldiphosphodolichol beta-mannosyltransferase n=1 Tax=Cephalotrichum gorgonifer TaxID=2041049 RepID=A0AAE8MRN5_9PEZI|nr:related to beta-1,4-mannosyltransferase [Cephalotrichum gorgonifer]
MVDFTILGGVIAAITLFSIYRALPTRYKRAASPQDDRYQVLVLGDIGRSPRMQYHALSIVRCGAKVDLVGYNDSPRHPGLEGSPLACVYPLSPTPRWLQWRYVGLLLKALWQSFNLFYTLAYSVPAAKWIIIQNPPSIPTFHIAYLVALLRGSRIMVDWHNYGHTIMQVSHSKRPLLGRLYKRYETFFGRLIPDISVTVTDAMARDLKDPPFSLRMPILTMHDRPAEIFQPIASQDERRRFLSRLPETRDYADKIMKAETRLVVSSTSWTPDEDFQTLLDALLLYGGSPAVNHEGPPAGDITKRPPLLVVITGKGPDKASFEVEIASLKSKGHLPLVNIKTAWLSMEDYATLLACADIGVCLHESSSGLDLPMKVVDMFGAGLPVLAYNAYASAGELIKDGVNGGGFREPGKLTAGLELYLGEGSEENYRNIKEGALEEGKRRWDDEWEGAVGKALGLVV